MAHPLGTPVSVPAFSRNASYIPDDRNEKQPAGTETGVPGICRASGG